LTQQYAVAIAMENQAEQSLMALQEINFGFAAEADLAGGMPCP
tara:strand:+ start:204 stop:332 length:129 start_codon:yes stop_codon:yes gene_type:complete